MQPLRVLAVDDELGMRMAVKRILGEYHFRLEGFEDEVSFEIEIAEDGAGALAALAERSPDIVILDHKLPDMQGLDILSHIQQMGKQITSIMITAYASLDVAISATRFGAFDFLAKPFTPEELRYTIQKAAKHLVLQRKALEFEQQKRQVRFQFLSVLAHELKSPLAAVEGYLKILDQHVAGEQLSEYDQMIDRSLVRIEGMRRMILDLLDLTKIEAGTKQRQIASLAVSEVVAEAAENVATAAASRNIAVEVEVTPDLAFVADRSELMMIFNNLLTNAVKYNKDGGHVRFAVVSENEGITITCADTGIGLSSEDQARLFQEFTRIKSEKTRHIEGSGLGLSILKKLIALYEGSVLLKSELDVGSTFTVHLCPAVLPSETSQS